MNRILPFAAILLVLSCSQKQSDKPTAAISQHVSPADTLSAEPHLFSDAEGNAYLSWLEKSEHGHVFKFSQYSEGIWSAPMQIASDSTWFVNWADYPMASFSRGGNLLAHVLNKSGEGTFAYDVKMYLSTDTGVHWDKSFVLHDDGKQAEHGFVSMSPYNDDFFVSWLDGRNTATEEAENADHHGGHHGSMSLRGAVLDSTGNKTNEWELDARTCDCCQTTSAITNNGPVVIYRDRSDEEIRDISITRFVDSAWTTPRPIFEDHWKIAGCPVNGPRSDAMGDNLAIVWFSSPEEEAQVKVILSKDNGASFGSPIRIDEGQPIGRVDIAWLDEKRLAASWMEAEQIKAIVIHTDGTIEKSFTIATSSKSRASGFPQMIRAGKELIFAWTDDSEKKVKIASVRLQPAESWESN